jgi:2-oxoglutarate dehydrogenase E2 component (dihydrolipoamide succinyltransferase)
MAKVEMVMPKMGESIIEATILKWLKKPGDKIEHEESILEVATDKVDTEVPSLYAGVLQEILFKEGDVVKVGAPIAIIESEAAQQTLSKAVASQPTEVAKPTILTESKAEFVQPVVDAVDYKSAKRFYSPLVKMIAKEENISIVELESVTGSGLDGRVTKTDLLAHIELRKSGVLVDKAVNQSAAPLVSASVIASDEIIQMDRMRKMIAERMVDSKRTSPHVTSFVEADVTNIVLWRNKTKKHFEQREGESLKFTPIFVEAVMMAIKDFPMINIQVDGDKIIKKKDINIGIAVALPSGNLIVPVIKNADKYNLLGLAKVVNDLAKRARENKLKPDDLSGGTFTVSNVGTFGNVMGTPIIMQPQVAILAIGAIQKKPAVLETVYGDVIAIRHKMFLSHSYDHRVVDGALGGSFVRRVADYLEKFDLERPI